MPGRLAALVTALPALCLWGCLSVAGRGSEVENPEVYGVMVDESGEAVVGARVMAYPAAPDADMPAVPVDSAITGRGGRYALSELPAGEYNVVGDFQGGRLLVLIPEVRFEPGTGLDLGQDTLRDPGGIQGRVRQGDAGRSGVMAYIPGTSYLALTDAEGAFLLPSVPGGVYRVNYQAAGLRADPDTGVVVEPGLITRLPDKVLAYDTATPPPAPSRVEAAFDTLLGVVSLRWNSVRLEDLFGYRVYRDAGPLSLPEAVSGIVTDTVFTDTVRKLIVAGKPLPVFGYRLRTVDRQRNEGIEFSEVVRVAFAPPSQVTTTLSLRLVEAQVIGKVGVGRPARLRLEWTNPTRRLRRVEWYLDSSLVRTAEVEAVQGTDSLVPSFAEPGIHRVEIRATDEAGVVGTAALTIEVVIDPPFCWAGADEDFLIGDTVRLRPQAFDVLGRVVRWEWELGASGVFQEAPLGILDFQVPDTDSNGYRCILKVTDDDGNIAQDTMFVRVVPGTPVAQVFAWPQEAFLEDTIVLSADSSRDAGRGRIVAWEWDIGKRGVFVPSPDGTYRIHGAVSSAGVVPCVLRVTDDDGLTDTAEVAVTFRDPDQWALWIQDQDFQENHLFDAWISEDRLHVLGRRPGGVHVLASTSDMHSWESSPITGLPDAMWEVRASVHAEQTWLIDRNTRVLWHSRTGGEWDSVAPPEFRELQDMALMSHAGALWLAGHRGWHPSRGEHWRSQDGTAWTRVSDSTPYGDGWIVTGISWKGRVWAIVQKAVGSESELWSSEDGRDWRSEAGGNLQNQGWGAGLVVHQDRLWVVSSNEARNTGDGATWTEVPLQVPDVPSHHLMRLLSFQGRLWMVTGSSAGGEQQWRIWRAPF